MKATLVLLSLTTLSCVAQVQTAWIRTYHNDLPGKTNQPVAVKLDTAGNIIVTGSSQNTAGDSDYVVLKYAQDGTKLWEARYASPIGGQDEVAACALDPDNNVYVIGTSKTLKYSPTGTLLWEADYAGADLCWDRTNVYVTGLSNLDYATAKLSALNGTNIWTRANGFFTQHVATDSQGNVYASGYVQWMQDEFNRYYAKQLVKYTPAGNLSWGFRGVTQPSTEVRNLGLKVQGGNIYTISDSTGWSSMYIHVVSSGGVLLWRWHNNVNVTTGGMAVGSGGTVILAGTKNVWDSGLYRLYKSFTFNKVPFGSAPETKEWEQLYPSPNPAGYGGKGMAIALDARENVVTAGYIYGPTADDMVTLKYSNDGKQLWARQYNGAANGNDRAVALAVAPDDSIYVAGYSATAEGGTEMVLIKYVEPRVNATPKTSGDVQIQMNGVPGSRYAFQSSGDLQTWLSLSTNTTDATGQATFTDTNASNLYPFRFYRSLLLP